MQEMMMERERVANANLKASVNKRFYVVDRERTHVDRI